MVQGLSVPHKPRRRPGRRPGTAATQPEHLALSRLTVIFSDRPFATENLAERWMRKTVKEPEAFAEALADASRLVNKALHAHSISTQNPYIPQLSPSEAVAARIGHGLGHELAEGNFSQATELPTAPPSRRRRQDQVAPQERVAAILGGRENANACETFVLRARLDFDAGRYREATLGLSVAVETMLIEMDGALTDPAHVSDLSLLSAQQGDLNQLSQTARIGPLDRAMIERTDDLIALCERVLRRRRLLRG